MKTVKHAALMAGASLAAIAASPALAQDEPEATQTRAPLDTVVVTARRVEETLQQVPVAVTAVSQEDLADLGAENVGALQGVVPNLNIVQGRGSSSSANIFIRGVGQPDALATFDPAVGVYVDDVFYSRIRGALVDVYDVERIEVLRGPQGTLYGKNTNGGALKIITRKPGDEVRAAASLTVGSYNQIEATARLAGPIVEDKIAAGLSLYTGHRDGFVDDPLNNREYNDKDTFAIRGQLNFTPTENFELLITGDYTHESPRLTVGQAQNDLFAIDLDPDLNPLTPATAIVPLMSAPTEEWDYETSTTPGFQNSNELDHVGVSAQSTWCLNSAWTLKSISAYRSLVYDDYIDIDATVLELGDVFVGVDQDQTSQEFQLLYDNGGRFNGVVGLYWLNENIESTQIAFADDFLVVGSGVIPGGIPLAFERDIFDNLNLHSWAVFANGTLDLTDRLSASAGVRFTNEIKHYGRGTTTSFDPVGFEFQVRDEWDDISPAFSLDYQATENVLVYGRVSKGFKSGGFNGRANNPNEEQPYEPEEVWSYEAGFKGDLFDNRLRANAAVFYNDYKDFQARVSDTVQAPDPVTGNLVPTPVFTVLNAGALEIWGAELELLAAPTDQLTLQAAIGWLDAQYEEFLDERYPGGDRAPFEEPAFSPDLTLRAAAEYVVPLGGGKGELEFGGDVQYRGDMALAVDQSEQALLPLGTVQRIDSVFQDEYWLLDARVGWTSEDGHWGVTLHGENLTDELYKTDYQEFSSVGGIRTAYFGNPRTFSVRISWRN